METTKIRTDQGAEQHSGAHVNGNSCVSAKKLSTRPHRSEAPPPGRKMSFEEAKNDSLTRHAEALRRLAK